jgi:serine/threonine protein kinase
VPETVTRCPTCQTELGPGTRFCPKDGTTIRPDSILIPVEKPAANTAAMKRAAIVITDPNKDKIIGRVIDGRYRIRARLGEGGIGAVYEAEHVQIRKTVALKVLHPLYASTEEFRKRFEREARAASRLDHPACVQVMDFGRVEKLEPPSDELVGTPYLVMEFVRGQVLIDRLIDGPKVEPHEAIAIARDLLGALKHAHALGIVHRDIKPANIMLLGATEAGTRVKLLDFGLAKELLGDADGKEAPLTQAGMVFGTPGYLSPEQASGYKVDPRADLYSLGVVLFEMCCNRRLFERADPLDAVRDHLNTPPPDPRSINRDISPALAKVILTALAKDREKRFPSAAAFAEALAACPEAGGPQTQAKAPSSLARLLDRARNRKVQLVGAAALVGVAAIVIGVVALSHGREEEPFGSTSNAPAPPPAPAPRFESDGEEVPSPGARHAYALLRMERPDDAMRAAREALHLRSGDPWAHAALAAAYSHKLWCSDALDELDKALREQPALKKDPLLSRPAIGCLGHRTAWRAARYLVDEIGPDARRPLEEAMAGLGGDARRNAEAVLAQLPP